jgi:AcrR family transcriptional regulator
MGRPSRNIDQVLLDSGLALLPRTGARRLSVRQVAEHAGVNLGMFHYHFRTKENFVRAVLERMYEEMFSDLELQVDARSAAPVKLRKLLATLGRFAVKHRLLIARLVSETMSGERLAADFLQRNVPRHLKLIADVIGRGQQEGTIVNESIPLLVAFTVGAVAGPLLLGTALEQNGLVTRRAASGLRANVASEQSLNRRIELVLRALTTHPGEEIE